MKLVEILARELKEWPEGYKAIVQNNKDYTLPIDCLDVYWDGSQWDYKKPSMRIYEKQFSLSSIASDHATAIVTREMWQAAKDKLEGKVKVSNPLRRNRGNEPQYEGEVKVRFRNGEKAIYMPHQLNWTLTGQKVKWEVTSWRPHVATSEQSSEVEQSVKVSDHVKISVTPIPVPDDFNPTAEETESARRFFEGPLQWRDRIHAIDSEQKSADEAHKAATDARTAERAELVQKLAGEGLALLGKAGDPQHDEWKELAERENSLTPAIKAHREAYGSSLKQALETVKAYREEIGFTVE